jgi:hypothetical protein
MPVVRYFVLALFVCAPTLTLAQPQDSVIVRTDDGDYGAYPALFGQYFEEDVLVGPAPLVHIEPAIGCEEDPEDPDVFIPAVENPEELEGNIALISRGDCAFVLKVEAASSAGAIGVVVYNDDRVDPDNEDLVNMSGDCYRFVCSAPAVFVSRASGLALLNSDVGEEVLLDPVDINPVCGSPADFGTNRVRTFLYRDGFIGTSPRSDDRCFRNFGFEGDDGLGIASVLVGQERQGEAVVTGSPYGAPEYEIGWSEPAWPPFDPPFEDFDRSEVNIFFSPLGLEVTERGFARDEDAFIVLDLHITNTTDEELSGVYVGLFADWAVGDAQQNLGGFDESTNLLYVYDESETSTNYFGIAALGVADVAGWTLATDGAASDSSLFAGMTTAGELLEQPQDARTVIGLGPFDLAPGDSADVRWAMVAGVSQEDIVASAQAAQQAVFVASETAPPEQAFALAPVFPNPAASHATVRLDLPSARAVRVAVFDVLGRRVAVLHDGPLGAGAHRLRLDASALPIGTYFVRVEAGGMQRAQPFTVVR